MNIWVNGEARELEARLTVQGLLQQLGLGGKPVVVELNRRALFPREHATEELKEGDAIEIVQITAGG